MKIIRFDEFLKNFCLSPGIETTTIGFGFSNLLSGLFALTRPFLIDYIKVNTNSYDNLLIVNSLLCLLATVPWYYQTAASTFKLFRSSELESSKKTSTEVFSTEEGNYV